MISKKFLVVFSMFLLVVSFVSAANDFVIRNKTDQTPYFIVNGTTGNVDVSNDLNVGGVVYGDGSGLINLNVSSIDLSDYIPYVGADKNIDLGNNNFSVGGGALFVNSDTGKVGVGIDPHSFYDLRTNNLLVGSLTFNGGGSMGPSQYYTALNDMAFKSWNGTNVVTNMFLTAGNNGRLGLGTITPQNALNVIGEGNFTGDVYADRFVGDGSHLTNLNISGLNGSTQWLNEGNDIYYQGGSVGIGTSPDGTSASLVIDTTESGSGNAIYINDPRPIRWTGGAYIGPSSGMMSMYSGGNDMTFRGYNGTDVVDSLFVDVSTSRIGIGTETPQYKLDVDGRINAEDVLINGSSISLENLGGVTGNGTAGYVPVWDSQTGLGDSIVSQMGSSLEIEGDRPISLNSEYGAIEIKAPTGGFAFGLSAELDNGTNVGGFNFYGIGDDFRYYYIGRQYNDASMVILENGRVGIGRNSPVSLLHLDAGYYGDTSGISFSDSDTRIYEETDDQLTFNVEGGERMIVNSSGVNVNGDVCTGSGCLNDALSGNVDVNNSQNLDGYDSSFFMPLNKSVYGDFDFNGGWTDGGVSIVDGNVYAQSGYFYDINSLQVTNLAVNGSLIPDLDNSFDLGNSIIRWRDAYFSGDVESEFFNTGNGSMKLGDSMIQNGDINSVPTNDQVYDFVEDYITSGGGDSVYVRKDGDVMTGTLEIRSNSDGMLGLRSTDSGSQSGVAEGGWNYISFRDGQGDRQGYFGLDSAGNFRFQPEVSGANVVIYSDLLMNNNAISNVDWSASDDGSGSELDADFLDGYDSSDFMMSNASTSYWNVSGSNIYPEDLSYNVGIGTTELDIVDNMKIFDNSPYRGVLKIENNASSGLVGSELFLKTASQLRGQAVIFQGGDKETWGIGTRYGGGAFQIGYIPDATSVGAFGETETLRSTNALVTINEIGRVGIGTSNPRNELNVVGDLNVTGIIYGASFDGIESNWNTSGSNLYPADLTKNIGIGTVTPSADLDIYGDTAEMRFSYNDTSYSAISTTADGDIRIDSTSSYGGVGIGRDPSYALDVSGTIRGDGFRATAINSYSTANDGRLTLSLGGNPTITRNQADSRPSFVVQNLNEGSTGDILQLKNSSDTLMVVNIDGNVGIGTGSPQNELNVIGDGNFTGNVYAASFVGDGSQLTGLPEGSNWNVSGGNIYPEDLSYNVGIGMTSPGEKLHIHGSSTEDTAIRVDTTAADAELRLTTLSQKDWTLGIDYSDSGKFKIADSGTVGTSTRMTFDGGNVGIGTDSPEGYLEVSKTITNSGTKGLKVDLEGSSSNLASQVGADVSIIQSNYANPDHIIGLKAKAGTSVRTSSSIYGVHSTADYQTTFYDGASDSTNMFAYYGKNNFNISEISSRQIDNIFGAYLTAELGVGTTVSDYYGLFLDSPTGAGSILNEYGVYQESSSADNYFAGNVGVGVDSPGYRLDVAGQINAEDILINGTAISSSLFGSDVWNRSGTNVFPANLGDSVGIGTDSPVGKLHISDGSNINSGLLYYISENNAILSANEANIGYATIIASNTPAVKPNNIFVRSRGTLASPLAVQKDDVLGSLLFSGFDGTNNAYSAGVFAYVDGAVSSTNVPTRLSFATGGSSATRQERLTIKSDGNVGIGTNTPNERLDVNNGNLYISDSNMFGHNVGSGIMFGNPSGYSNNWHASISPYTTTGYDRVGLIFNISSGSSASIEAMRISPEGNLGIGKTTANEALDVEGNIEASGNVTAQDSIKFGGSTLTTDSNGDVQVW